MRAATQPHRWQWMTMMRRCTNIVCMHFLGIFAQCHCFEAVVVSPRWLRLGLPFTMEPNERTGDNASSGLRWIVYYHAHWQHMWCWFIHVRDDILHICNGPNAHGVLHERTVRFYCTAAAADNYERFALVKGTWSFSAIIFAIGLHATSVTRAAEIEKRRDREGSEIDKRIVVLLLWSRPFPFFLFFFASFAVKFSISSVFALRLCVCVCSHFSPNLPDTNRINYSRSATHLHERWAKNNTTGSRMSTLFKKMNRIHDTKPSSSSCVSPKMNSTLYVYSASGSEWREMERHKL